jgi:apolipoprotein N-acyltransferase
VLDEGCWGLNPAGLALRALARGKGQLGGGCICILAAFELAVDLLGIWSRRDRRGGAYRGAVFMFAFGGIQVSWVVSVAWRLGTHLGVLPVALLRCRLRALFPMLGAVLGCRGSGDLVGPAALPFPSARRPVALLGAFPARGRRGSGAAAAVGGGIGRWE